MSNREITINNGSKGRKQVNFDFDPLTLRSTITNGGNYNVAVGPMPLTSQAQQLSESLKRLPAIGKQFAQIQQGIGEERAGLIQGADAEEELNRLKEEEPETFFNFMRRKAYSDSLIEKHVRTQMVPNTLHGLKSSADAKVFKNENDFNANIDEQLSSSWQEFEQSVGEDVANSVAGKTIWNNLADQMRVEAQASYYESQDAVALENNLESIEHRISSQLSPVDAEGKARDIDLNFVADFTKTAIPELMDKHGMSRKEASNHLRTIMATRLKTLQVEGKNLMVMDLAEAMNRTVSKDGVPIYEGDSATSLSIAQTVASARDEIEDLEEEENDLDQVSQKEFTGQLRTAADMLANGARFSSLTPNQQLAVLKPIVNLDSTFTIDDLTDKMMSQGATDVGGGLEVFESILMDYTVNGTDRAQRLIDVTRTAYEAAVVTASQIQGPPKVIRNLIKRNQLQDKYRSESMMDPEMSLTQFLKKENVTSWDELGQIEEELVGVKSVMTSPVYKEVKNKTKLAIKESFATLEEKDALGIITPEARDKLIDDFGTQIQNILKQEAGSGALESDEYEARSKALVATAQSSMLEIMRATEGMDIAYEETNEPDDAVGQQELRHNTVADTFRRKNEGFFGNINPFNFMAHRDGETFETVAPFKTNESRGKTLQQKRDQKAFGFIPLYDKFMTSWSSEEIEADRAEMIKRIDKKRADSGSYKDALGYSLYAHGLDVMDSDVGVDKALSLMEKAGMDAMDVALFTSKEDISVFAGQMDDAYQKVLALEPLTPEDKKLIEQAKFLGLIISREVNEESFTIRAHQFVAVQNDLIKRHVK
tara:strand:+ start:707 stop:3178 length:2472 start_codon:yes stop_codon:yes gene_type:complete